MLINRKMQVAKAAIQFKIPRYKLYYWIKTGLFTVKDHNLTFKDLRLLRFIIDCRNRNISLQKIRSVIQGKWGLISAGEGDNMGRNLLIHDSLAIVCRDKSNFLQSETSQYFFNYKRDEINSLIYAFDIKKRSQKGRSDDIDLLEKEFQDALSDKKDDEILKILEKILAIDPDHPGALIEYGNISFESGSYETAIDYYGKALELNSDCVEAIYNLANLYFKQKKHAASIRYFQRAIEIDPEFPESYYNLALVYYSLYHFELSKKLFEFYIQLDPASEWCIQAQQFIEDINKLAASDVDKQSQYNLFGSIPKPRK